MSKIPQELISELVENQEFSSTAEVMNMTKELFKNILQEVMERELHQHLDENNLLVANGEAKKNYRNGYSSKKVKTDLGEVAVQVPRDRNGEFSPEILGKHQRNTGKIEDKVISLYAAGMSTRDISAQIKELFEINISADTVSNITNKVIPHMKEWLGKPLENVYPFIFMDAIHFKVRDNHQIITKAAYVVLGVTLDGYKEILGVWIGENESSKFWLSVLNELKTRGINEVFLFCVDGLTGLKEAIGATYPMADIQRCIIHQIRASTRYVSYKDVKIFMKDLKAIYRSSSEESAFERFMEFKETWESNYPSAVNSWEQNWDVLSTFFKYPLEMRSVIYTTNIIESLNRQYRKVTKTKSIFPNDESLLKMLYLASVNIEKKWTMRYRNWDMILNQLKIMFEDRLNR